MKKALPGPDIGQLVKGWQSLIGSRVDQFGRPDLNKTVLKLIECHTSIPSMLSIEAQNIDL